MLLLLAATCSVLLAARVAAAPTTARAFEVQRLTNDAAPQTTTIDAAIGARAKRSPPPPPTSGALIRPLRHRPLLPPTTATSSLEEIAALAPHHPAEPAARRARAARRALLLAEEARTSRRALTAATNPNPRRPNATLPMLGAVIDGYFYTTVRLGTPPREYDVIVDTGSTMTYVPCEGCSSSGACGPHTERQGAFDPSASSTARRVPCGDAECRCGSPACTCRERVASGGGGDGGESAADKGDPTPATGACAYSRVYAEHSSSSGDVVSDVLHLEFGGAGDEPNGKSGGGNKTSSSGGGSGDGTTPAPAAPAPQPPRITFGCVTRETGEIHRQAADGLLGMGASDDALHAQLARAGATDPAFALCLGFPSGGALVLGSAVPAAAAAAGGATRGQGQKKMQYTPFLDGKPANPSSSRGAHYFAVAAEGLAYAGEELRFGGGGAGGGEDGGNSGDNGDGRRHLSSPSTPSTSKAALNVGYGAVFDSGTTFLYLPNPAFQAFRAAASKAAAAAGLTPRPGPDPEFPDVCWTVPADALEAEEEQEAKGKEQATPTGQQGDSAASSSFPASAAHALSLAATERLMRALERGKSRLPHAELRFAGGARLELSPRRYLWRDDTGDEAGGGAARGRAVCLGVFDNGREGTLVGAVATRDAFVQYDVGGGRLGFMDADCAAMGERALLSGGGADAAPAPAEPSAVDFAAAESAAAEEEEQESSSSSAGGFIAGVALAAAVAGGVMAAVAFRRWRGAGGGAEQRPSSSSSAFAMWRPVAGADGDEDEDGGDDGTQLTARPWVSYGGKYDRAERGDGGGGGGGDGGGEAAAAARSREESALIAAALATTPTRSGPI